MGASCAKRRSFVETTSLLYLTFKNLNYFPKNHSKLIIRSCEEYTGLPSLGCF